MTKVPVDFEKVSTKPVLTQCGGYSLPQELKQSVWKNRVALKGPLTTPIGKGMRSLNLEIRKEFQLYANVRPSKTIPGLQTIYGNIDVITIRENTEGEYSGIEHMISKDIAQSVKVITQKGSYDISKFAFNYAKNNNRKMVTACHKANIMYFVNYFYFS